MTPEQIDAICKEAGVVVLSAPERPSQYAKFCLVDREALDALSALLTAAGYDMKAARKRMKALIAEQKKATR
jgi:hypothetical protein